MNINDLAVGDRVRIAWENGDVTADTVKEIRNGLVYLELDNWTWPELIETTIKKKITL
jgi:hypothetical protein